MKYYPVNLDIRNRSCLVVGGGSVGARKVRGLLKSGALVQVVSPDITPDIRELSETGLITVAMRPYRPSDLEGMFLVIGATSDPVLNRSISRDAERLNMLCNIADVPDACNFILPSIVERGDLIIAVSTSGKSPAFAKALREKLEKQFGEEYAEFLRLMGAIRAKLLEEEHAPEAHKHLFEALIEGGLLEMIRCGSRSDINRLLGNLLGEGFDVDSLAVPTERETKTANGCYPHRHLTQRNP